MTNRLSDYPSDIQFLLEDAAWHLEQLDVLERRFKAWQAQAEAPPIPSAETLLWLRSPSKAQRARTRWEARVRTLAARKGDRL